MRFRIHLDAAGCPEVPVVSDKMRAMSILYILYPKCRTGIYDITFGHLLISCPCQTYGHYLPWLPRSPRLAVMVFSGLFQDRFIDQVQVVGYLHDQMAMADRNSGGGIQLGFEMGFGLELAWLWHEMDSF